MAIKLHVGEPHNVPLKVSGDRIRLNIDGEVQYRSYNDLIDKPSINNVELTGDKSFSDLGLNDATTESSGLMSASDKTSLEAIKNVKGIFAVTTETTFEEISEAVNAGKYPILLDSSASGYIDDIAIPYIATFVDTDFDPHPMWHEFGAWLLEGRIFIGFKCDNNNQWSQLRQLQLGTDVTEFSTTSEIPNAYDVYDKLIHKVSWGDVDSSVTEDSDNPVSSRGISTALAGKQDSGSYAASAPTDATNAAIYSAGIPYAQVDSTSTSTVFTATVPGITELKHGTCMFLKNGVVTSAAGFTINVNGLGAKPVYSNMSAATADTTLFNVNYTMFFVYDTNRVTGGCWVCYRGYNSDTNTIAYQVRTNYQSLAMKSVTYRYRLLFTSADNYHYVPANNSTSTNATAKRDVCQDPINPFGSIFYYGTTASVAAGSRPAVASLWEQYQITLGYSFNRTGAALTLTSWRPVYVKCSPQSDNSAIIDATTPYVQALPTTADGYIYIYLGIATSATAVELEPHHPIYCYNDGKIKLWVG